MLSGNRGQTPVRYGGGVEPVKVLITDMPGAAWWEFLVQWGGLHIQFAVAAGTIGAVIVALRSSQRSEALSRERDSREGKVIFEIVKIEVSSTFTALTFLRTQLELARASPEDAPLIAANLENLKMLSAHLDMDRTWSMIDKVHLLDSRKSLQIARLLAQISIMKKGVTTIVRWETPTAERTKQCFVVRELCRLMEWMCLDILDQPIDKKEYPYT